MPHGSATRKNCVATLRLGFNQYTLIANLTFQLSLDRNQWFEGRSLNLHRQGGIQYHPLWVHNKMLRILVRIMRIGWRKFGAI